MENYIRGMTRGIVICCFAVVLTMLAAGPARADIPARINYQGKLTDTATGEAMPGQHDAAFRVYDQAIGGSLLWQESRTVTADANGVFSVLLGAVQPVDVGFEGSAWLEVEVDSEVLSPRRELASVPFAFRAANADSLDGLSRDSLSIVGHTHSEYVAKGELFSVTAGMIAGGAITDADVSHTAEIDPSKIAGTAWTSTNDGSGNGLDADMVDGLHAEAFADSDHTHDDRYYTEAELHVPGILNEESNPVDWTKLKNLPAGFLDGIDDVGGVGDGHSLDAADGSPVDAVYVNNAGNVGVKTTNPATALDVQGDINTSSVYRLDGKRVLDQQTNNYLFVGIGAGGNNTGQSVTCIGDSAGYNNQGWYNTFIGDHAGFATSDGYYNTMIGLSAGVANTDGDYNTYIGHLAAVLADTAGSNTYVGSFAGHRARGTHNTFIGEASGFNADGDANTALGTTAGYSNASGNGNIFIGNAAGFNETGSNKLYIANGPDSEDVFIYGEMMEHEASPRVGIGTKSPRSMLVINDNVENVYPHWPTLAIGSRNATAAIILGSDGGNYADMSWRHPDGFELWSSKYISFDTGGSGSFTDEFMMDDQGRFGIGTETPERAIHIVGDNPRVLVEASTGNAEINLKDAGDAGGDIWAMYKESVSGDLRFYQSGDRVTLQASTGNVGIGTDNPGTCKLYVNGGASGTGAWGSCSDVRFKDNIDTIGDALGKVLNLRGVTFDWKTDEHPDKNFDDGTHFGVIAQEIEEVLPEVIREGPDGDKAVAYSEIVPVLIESIKSQQNQIEELRAEVRELQAAVAAE